MIHVTTVAFDPFGLVSFNTLPSEESRDLERRTSVVPTLDVSVSVYDGGFTHAGRQLDLVDVNPTSERQQRLSRLIQFNTRLMVSNREGLFLVSPLRLSHLNNQVTLRVVVNEKVA